MYFRQVKFKFHLSLGILPAEGSVKRSTYNFCKGISSSALLSREIYVEACNFCVSVCVCAWIQVLQPYLCLDIFEDSLAPFCSLFHFPPKPLRSEAVITWLFGERRWLPRVANGECSVTKSSAKVVFFVTPNSCRGTLTQYLLPNTFSGGLQIKSLYCVEIVLVNKRICHWWPSNMEEANKREPEWMNDWENRNQIKMVKMDVP